MTERRQTLIGLALAAAVTGAWAALTAAALFRYRLEGIGIAAAPLLSAVLCWLNVGLFIVAHDAMHGSLAPSRPGLNAFAGHLALACYVGFSYARLKPKHFAHHTGPGTPEDPDFATAQGSGFWRWYAAFVRQYFGLRELALLAVLAGLLALLGAPPANLALFWALPAIVSSLQLFLFGTWLPHRPGTEPFADRHRTRSSGLPWLLSLLSCYHFGYHHEHHRAPHVPWWRLPAERLRGSPPR